MRPPLFLALLATVACVALAPPPPAATEEPERQPHRLWDDGGTLDWRTTIAEAMELAAERRRLIFVEWGRES